MRASHFFSKLLLGVLSLPTFLSAELINFENDLEMSGIHAQDNLEMSSCHSSDSRKKHHESVFASYRNSKDLTVPGGGNVLFNEKNANKGGGIRYNEDGFFTIKKSGFYLINYGLASIGNAGTVGAAFGFNLLKISNGQKTIVDSVLANDSSAIVLFLKEDDRIAIVSQKFKTKLIAGNLPPRTTSLTDTAHISILRLER
jgi:hypothetical protein